MVISENTLPDLKDAYKEAKHAGHDTFIFQGATLYLGYAKYLIEYLETGFDEVRR